MATVFQEVLVADDCSVVDNLFMGSDGLFSQSNSSAAKIRAAAALMADLTGTSVDVQGLAGVLPLSLKQWITIGRALLRKPKVLILTNLLQRSTSIRLNGCSQKCGSCERLDRRF